MSESKASRTLVKSPPELWSEVSKETSLQRHMDQFGEIRITKLEPETAVAWEGEHARGTITLEASGWGTKVSLTAEPLGASAEIGTAGDAAGQSEPGPGSHAEPEPGNESKPEPANPVDRLADRVGAELHVGRIEAAAAETRERAASLERDRREAAVRKRRWTQRLTRTFRGWFGPPAFQAPDPVAHAPEPVPERPARPPAVVTSGPAQPADPAAPAAPELEQPKHFAAPTAVERAPDREPPPQPDAASTSALDAALDSLGQAHHRPFSRA